MVAIENLAMTFSQKYSVTSPSLIHNILPDGKLSMKNTYCESFASYFNFPFLGNGNDTSLFLSNNIFYNITTKNTKIESTSHPHKELPHRSIAIDCCVFLNVDYHLTSGLLRGDNTYKMVADNSSFIKCTKLHSTPESYYDIEWSFTSDEFVACEQTEGDGGAICFTGAKSILTMSKSSLTDCKATADGACGGGVSMREGKLEFSSVNITNCTAAGHGGCLYLNSNSQKITCNDSKFISGAALNGCGGGIVMIGDDLVIYMKDCEWKECVAMIEGKEDGGGSNDEAKEGSLEENLNESSECLKEIKYNQLDRNSSLKPIRKLSHSRSPHRNEDLEKGKGGGFVLESSEAHIYNCIFESCATSVKGVSLHTLSQFSTLTLTYCRFDESASKKALSDYVLLISDSHISISYSNITCPENKKSNGAIKTLADNGEMDINTTSFNRVTVTSPSSAVVMRSGGYLTLTECTFDHCTATGNGILCSVSNQEVQVSITDTEFISCTSDANGRSLITIINATVQLKSVKFKDCSSETQSTLALSPSEQPIVMESVTFDTCTSPVPVPAAFLFDKGSAEISKSQFISCTSKSDTCICATGEPKELTVRETNFSHCRASGGSTSCITLVAGTATIDSCRFDDCTAYLHAGAISITKTALLKLSNSYFTNCAAEAGDGGAVLLESSLAASKDPPSNVVEKCSFAKCKCVADGCGIAALAKNVKLLLSECMFDECTSTPSFSGALYYIGVYLSVERTWFKGCRTETGGGGAIYIDTKNYSIVHCSFEDCHAITGGAVSCHFPVSNEGNGSKGKHNDIAIQPVFKYCSFFRNTAFNGVDVYVYVPGFLYPVPSMFQSCCFISYAETIETSNSEKYDIPFTDTRASVVIKSYGKDHLSCGTEEDPCCSITFASALVAAQATLYLKQGTYTEHGILFENTETSMFYTDTERQLVKLNAANSIAGIQLEQSKILMGNLSIELLDILFYDKALVLIHHDSSSFTLCDSEISSVPNEFICSHLFVVSSGNLLLSRVNMDNFRMSRHGIVQQTGSSHVRLFACSFNDIERAYLPGAVVRVVTAINPVLEVEYCTFDDIHAIRGNAAGISFSASCGLLVLNHSSFTKCVVDDGCSACLEVNQGSDESVTTTNRLIAMNTTLQMPTIGAGQLISLCSIKHCVSSFLHCSFIYGVIISDAMLYSSNDGFGFDKSHFFAENQSILNKEREFYFDEYESDVDNSFTLPSMEQIVRRQSNGACDWGRVGLSLENVDTSFEQCEFIYGNGAAFEAEGGSVRMNWCKFITSDTACALSQTAHRNVKVNQSSLIFSNCVVQDAQKGVSKNLTSELIRHEGGSIIEDDLSKTEEMAYPPELSKVHAERRRKEDNVNITLVGSHLAPCSIVIELASLSDESRTLRLKNVVCSQNNRTQISVPSNDIKAAVDSSENFKVRVIVENYYASGFIQAKVTLPPSLSTEAIIGIVIGCLVLTSAIVGICLLCILKKKKQKKDKRLQSDSNEMERLSRTNNNSEGKYYKMAS
ncbi:uncharacterized protein MONOS_13788 [Monocercomonoides exilis]|uniref:uncharacterized protein n=1 Tax=Monocercomonoides exilis TaxID=2049356 RepID=UPI003559D967|nr:hypothetical protein MONOS_13788 [Monocercomonoides exilis]|eukprot:MONOS_13788.1-p1 / transcript=MONOS_13788.1 / gene=MONOS_13788 / organism=Monocercomonoides_exilis_PA203 / gene_product=unspecified product / transcript_product=unspecified product / location=Mono_scaffold00884:2762-7470(-) / protein_length=1516 / sequence_SO=supercontig / SO=protein_coding / is_pseudo=false